MKKDPQQRITVTIEMLKSISLLKSPSLTVSTSPAKPETLPTTEATKLSSSTLYLEKEKQMLQPKGKLLVKRTTNPTTQTKKFVPFDICDPFIEGYHKITYLVY